MRAPVARYSVDRSFDLLRRASHTPRGSHTPVRLPQVKAKNAAKIAGAATAAEKATEERRSVKRVATVPKPRGRLTPLHVAAAKVSGMPRRHAASPPPR